MDVLPESPSSVLVATNDFNLRLIDIRSKNFQHLWKTHFPTGGIFKNYSTLSLSLFLSLSIYLSIYLSISLNRSFASHLIITGAIRFLVSCGTWVAAGNVNGVINIIDIRSGELLYHWKPADKWPLPVSILTVV